jgi:hypothetical protein
MAMLVTGESICTIVLLLTQDDANDSDRVVQELSRFADITTDHCHALKARLRP